MGKKIDIKKIMANFDKLPLDKQNALTRKLKQIMASSKRSPVAHRVPNPGKGRRCKRLHQ